MYTCDAIWHFTCNAKWHISQANDKWLHYWRPRNGTPWHSPIDTWVVERGRRFFVRLLRPSTPLVCLSSLRSSTFVANRRMLQASRQSSIGGVSSAIARGGPPQLRISTLTHAHTRFAVSERFHNRSIACSSLRPFLSLSPPFFRHQYLFLCRSIDFVLVHNLNTLPLTADHSQLLRGRFWNRQFLSNSHRFFDLRKMWAYDPRNCSRWWHERRLKRGLLPWRRAPLGLEMWVRRFWWYRSSRVGYRVIMAKMADGMPLLSASTQRTLADKLYEKRKNAAREVPISRFRWSLLGKICWRIGLLPSNFRL